MKLAICIPTINRLSLLKETVASVLPQLNAEVKLYISNNASTDGTKEYLQELAENFPQVEVANWSDRADIDGSMERTVSMAAKTEKNKYIFLLGDDDILLPNAIQNITNELRTEPDILILNGVHTDNNLLVKHEHLPERLQGKVFHNIEEAFSYIWDKMPFSSFIARRECFRNFDIFHGTSHAYTGTIWYSLGNQLNISVKCGSQSTIMIRGGEKTWTPHRAVIMLYEIPKWFSLLERLPKLKKIIPHCRNNYFEDYAQPHMIYHLLSDLKKANFQRLKLFKALPWKIRWRFLKSWKL